VPVDYDAARDILTTEYEAAEELFREGREVALPDAIRDAIAGVFRSRTQAYREALVGCALARIQDQKINIRLPYVGQAPNAFNGRTLDERVVNPFLHEQQIPASRAPYLSSLRRGFQFQKDWPGQRDRAGLGAAVDFIAALEQANAEQARIYLRGLLYRFVALRDAADIALNDVHRLSIDQYGSLIDGLLSVRSGGLIPVLLAVATFQTISDCFELNWRIEWQGINVADRARGEAGDITVYRNNVRLFSVEVTEREIDRARVIATFQAKIGRAGLGDYLFIFGNVAPSNEAREVARQYFAQGHEINFVQIRDWILTLMTTIGPRCRRIFTQRYRALLGERNVPAALKVAWNNLLGRLMT
jgi:SacI restriction endonuclease